MLNKHMKIYSTSLVNREIQIKTKIRYHFTPTRVANNFLTWKVTRVREELEKLEPSYVAGRHVK